MKIQYASGLHLEFDENWQILRQDGPVDVCGEVLVLKTIGSTHCICNQFGYAFRMEHTSFDREKIIVID